MKKTVFLILCLFSIAAKAAELSTFAEIVAGVNQGKQLTFVMHANECKTEQPSGAVTISVTPNAIMLRGSDQITASDRHFTLNNPRALGTPLFEYVKYRIDADGSVLLKITLMKAASYETVSNSQIDCKLGEGFKVFA